MIRYFILSAIFALVLAKSAAAVTCTQINSECESKGLTSIIIGAPSDALGEAKGLVNVITNSGNISAAKLIVNIIAIPGPVVPSTIPGIPLPTHFR